MANKILTNVWIRHTIYHRVVNTLSIMEPFHVVFFANNANADARRCTGYACCTFPL